MGYKKIKNLAGLEYKRFLYYIDTETETKPDPIIEDIDIGSELQSLDTGSKWILNSNNEWVPQINVSNSTGSPTTGGIVDAPADGKSYIRENNQWVQLSNTLTTHPSRMDNPHKVNADQVGAYSKTETDSLIENSLKYKGIIATEADLTPLQADIGDLYYISNTKEFKIKNTVNTWKTLSSPETAIIDAPTDGKTYVRQNNQWIEVELGSIAANDFTVNLKNEPSLVKGITLINLEFTYEITASLNPISKIEFWNKTVLLSTYDGFNIAEGIHNVLVPMKSDPNNDFIIKVVATRVDGSTTEVLIPIIFYEAIYMDILAEGETDADITWSIGTSANPDKTNILTFVESGYLAFAIPSTCALKIVDENGFPMVDSFNQKNIIINNLLNESKLYTAYTAKNFTTIETSFSILFKPQS